MKQGFDEFFKENFEDGLSSPSKYMLKFTFEAGAQSRQAEIDELRKRINEALEILSQMKHNGAYKALGILKGQNHD